MKRAACAFLAALMIISLAACSVLPNNKEAANTAPSTEAPTAAPTEAPTEAPAPEPPNETPVPVYPTPGALGKLCGAPDEEFAQTCADLLVKAAPDGKGEAVFSAERQAAGKLAVEKANQILGGSIKLSDEKRPLLGGFILRNGSVEVNCSFETLVRLQKSEAAGDVARLLFPEG